MAPTANHTLDIARSQLGYTEPGTGDRPGTQHTKFGDWYAAATGQPAYRDTYWCAMFASWVFSQAGFAPGDAGRYGNCNPWIAWLKAHGRWGSAPRVGALVFFSWDGDSRAEHVGIVESIRPDGRIQTIEGNATLPGKHDGVYRMVRKGHIVGYGYPPYAAAPAPAPKPQPAPPGGGTMCKGKLRPTLRRGNTGPDVLFAQKMLGVEYSSGPGVFGPRTEGRVRWYQQMRHIPVTGVLDRATWQQIDKM